MPRRNFGYELSYGKDLSLFTADFGSEEAAGTAGLVNVARLALAKGNRDLSGAKLSVFEMKTGRQRWTRKWSRDFRPKTGDWSDRYVNYGEDVLADTVKDVTKATAAKPASRSTTLPFPVMYSVVGILLKGREYGTVKRLSKASLSGAIKIATASRQKQGYLAAGTHKMTAKGREWFRDMDPDKVSDVQAEFERLVGLTHGKPAKRGPRASVPRRGARR